jgi:hypothetical protein
MQIVIPVLAARLAASAAAKTIVALPIALRSTSNNAYCSHTTTT